MAGNWLVNTLAALDPDGTLRTRQPKAEAPKASAAVSVDVGDLPPLDRRITRARKWLSKAPGGVQGANGSKDTFYAARVLVHGFCLDADAALGLMLSDFNPKCDPPWSVRELEHKIRDAEGKPFNKPRGWMFAKDTRPPAPTAPAASPSVGHPTAPSPTEPTKPADAFLNEADDDPHKLARAVMAGYRSQDRRTLAFFNDQFDEWRGSHYCVQKASVFRGRINSIVRKELEAMQKTKLENHDSSSGELLPRMNKVTESLVSNVLAALQGMCALDVAESPCWINGASGPDPRELVATAKGIVHLPAYADGATDAVRPNTPDFFTFNAVTFAADPGAPEPVEWLKFLAALWPDDPQSVALLQEWFGYLLTPDTRQQKMLLMIGPPRSGKGTIARVLQELVGFENCCNPTLGILATPFGLSSLLGKSVAVIEDARLSARSDAGVVTERLLTISGEGRIDVDRKHRDIITGRLTTRFVVATNELPRLSDASGALARRWCLLRFTRSFLGCEDKKLADKLTAELSGIFNWAVAGWKRLRDQGRFTEPESVADVVEDLNAIGSPIGEFVKERCEVGEKYKAEVEELYAEWKKWCESIGRKEPGTINRFGVDLRAYVPGIRKERPRTSEGRINVYRGIRLKSPDWERSEESSEPAEAVDSLVRFGHGQL